MNKNTYLQAAEKLEALGHTNRSEALRDYANSFMYTLKDPKIVDANGNVFSLSEFTIEIVFTNYSEDFEFESTTDNILEVHIGVYKYNLLDVIYFYSKKEFPGDSGLITGKLFKDRKSAFRIYQLILSHVKNVKHGGIVKMKNYNTQKKQILDDFVKELTVNHLY